MTAMLLCKRGHWVQIGGSRSWYCLSFTTIIDLFHAYYRLYSYLLVQNSVLSICYSRTTNSVIAPSHHCTHCGSTWRALGHRCRAASRRPASRPARYTSSTRSRAGRSRAAPACRSCTRSASQCRGAAGRCAGRRGVPSGVGGGGGGGWSVVSGQWVPGYRGTPSPGLGAGHESAQVSSGWYWSAK